MAAQYKIRQSSTLPADSLPVSNLNLIQLAGFCNIDREIVDKVYSHFIANMGKFIMEGRKVVLTVSKVAELVIHAGELKCSLMGEFKSLFFQPSSKRVGASAVSASQAVDRHARMAQERVREEAADARRANSAGRARAAADSIPRARNPLFGDVSSGLRRPGSASSSTSTASSRSNRSVSSVGSTGSRPPPPSRLVGAAAPSQRRPVSAPRGGGGVQDARAVAARALAGVTDIVDTVRQKIVQRGGVSGIRGISKLLMIMDDNGDKRLTKEELK